MGEIADSTVGGLISQRYWSPYRRHNKFNKTCKKCGENGLYWESTKEEWRLFNSETEKIHRCRERAKEND